MDSNFKALKIEAARVALTEVRSGMLLGLGTGSTAEELVRLLGQAIAAGSLQKIRGICTSHRTQTLAESLGIPSVSLDEISEIDLAIDGADEIDPSLRLIKGRGGALLREKIVEQASKRFIVIADETKLVTRLGQGRLPVEVTSFAARLLERRLSNLGFDPKPRLDGSEWFRTDEGHRILDVIVPESKDISEVVKEIRSHAGVVETGFFPDEATEAIIATSRGVERIAGDRR